jgi:glutamine synthetase
MIKLEYIWIDGTEPTSQLRSKTKVVEEFDGSITGPSGTPMWSFDGSSTNQAPGDKSDCVLQPVRLYENPLDGYNSYLVLCEVFNTDETSHKTNHRFKLGLINSIHSVDDVWVGIEQEYTLYKDDRPLGWPVDDSEPVSQGDYYCGRNVGEEIARKHMDACIKCDIKISGINSEVMLGQWEYQVGADNPLRISDDLWVARWLLEKICAESDVVVSLDPKPVEGDWNGAGAHTNFSTKVMRDDFGLGEIHKAIKKLEYKHREHMEVYGDGNERRLTGKHETCDIHTFRSGVSDRGASVRIPWQVNEDGKGYLEDRRPSANMDPYLVCHKLIETICGEK